MEKDTNKPLKLIYFDARGRAEPVRLMLELRGVPYEYEAMPLGVWMQGGKERIQERTPFGQLPILEDGPFVLCQSRAISVYIARKLNLYGETIEESARVDEVYDTASELMMELAILHWDKEFHAKRAEHREASRSKLDRLQTYFTRARADAEHWVLPGRYTLADVMMAFALETMMPIHPGLVEEFTELHRFMTAFYASSGVREYVRSERRPRTWTISMATFAGVPEETHQWTD
jgi:glutathione S-transferase